MHESFSFLSLCARHVSFFNHTAHQTILFTKLAPKLSFLANIFKNALITPSEKLYVSHSTLQGWKFFFIFSKATCGFTVTYKLLLKDAVALHKTPLCIVHQESSHMSAFLHLFICSGLQFHQNLSKVKYTINPGNTRADNNLPSLLHLRWLLICYKGFLTHVFYWLRKPGREIMEKYQGDKNS